MYCFGYFPVVSGKVGGPSRSSVGYYWFDVGVEHVLFANGIGLLPFRVGKRQALALLALFIAIFVCFTNESFLSIVIPR